MKESSKMLNFLVAFLAILNYINCEFAIIPTKIEPCPVTGKELDFKGKLVQKDGVQSFSMTANLPYDIDEDFSFSLFVDKWLGLVWEEKVYVIEGNICEYLHKVIPNIWDKLKIETQPPIEADCHVIPGKYKLDNFQCSTKDISSPISLYGKYRLRLKMFKPDGEEVFCHIVEVEGKDF